MSSESTFGLPGFRNGTPQCVRLKMYLRYQLIFFLNIHIIYTYIYIVGIWCFASNCSRTHNPLTQQGSIYLEYIGGVRRRPNRRTSDKSVCMFLVSNCSEADWALVFPKPIMHTLNTLTTYIYNDACGRVRRAIRRTSNERADSDSVWAQSYILHSVGITVLDIYIYGRQLILGLGRSCLLSWWTA